MSLIYVMMSLHAINYLVVVVIIMLATVVCVANVESTSEAYNDSNSNQQPSYVGEWTEACIHTQKDLARQLGALHKGQLLQSNQTFLPPGKRQDEEIKAMCSMAADVYQRGVCAPHTRIQRKNFNSYIKEIDYSLWKYIPNAQVIGQEVAPGNTSHAYQDYQKRCRLNGSEECSKSSFHDPTTCMLLCDNQYVQATSAIDNQTGLEHSKEQNGACSFFIFEALGGSGDSQKLSGCKLRTQWQTGQYTLDVDDLTRNRQGFEVFARVSSDEALTINNQVLGRNDMKPLYYFFPFSISDGVQPCHAEVLARTECADMCSSSQSRCGENCAYFEYDFTTKMCQLYSQRPSEVQSIELRNRVVFPGEFSYHTFIKYSEGQQDALKVADIHWKRYTEDAVGQFKLDEEYLLLLNHANIVEAKNECWKSRHEVAALQSAQQGIELAATLDIQWKSNFKYVFEGLRVWIDVEGDIDSRQELLNSIALRLGLQRLKLLLDMCLIFNIETKGQIDIQQVYCKDFKALPLCQKTDKDADFVSTPRDGAILSYLTSFLQTNRGQSKHCAVTQIGTQRQSFSPYSGVCQWDLTEQVCSWCGVSCLPPGIQNLTVIVPNQGNAVDSEAFVNRIYVVPTHQLLNLTHLNKFELQVQVSPGDIFEGRLAEAFAFGTLQYGII